MKKFILFLVAFMSVLMASGQTITVFDSLVYKLNGGSVDTSLIFKYTEIDTVYVVNGSGDTVGMEVDTNVYDAVNLCLGDSLMIRCYGLSNGVVDNSGVATWSFGNGTMVENGSLMQTVSYSSVGCYDIVASIMNADSSMSTSSTVRVRIAEKPIKRIYDFGAICSSDSLLLKVGYDKDSYIMLKDIEFAESVTKEYATKTFIPDGPNCPEQCYTATVHFDEFPNGRTIMSEDDICSICIDMEHSYMSDFRLSITCPSGQTSILKYGKKGTDRTCDSLCPMDAPEGSYGGGSQYLGIPYGGSRDWSYDNISGNYCDSIYNMYGVGYTYCFSRNSNYTLASGRSADVSPLIADDYISCTDNQYQVQLNDYVFNTIPQPYANVGQTAQSSTFRTKRPSDHDNKTDYYAPSVDFTSLIGCPLNGDWSVSVCDFWGSDNGWVFSWSMDICGVSQGSCEYQVGVDSVIWEADSHLNFRYADSVNAYISGKDTSGEFPLTMKIYDDFGCVWTDTNNIKIVHTPLPNLGEDFSICQSDSVLLDGDDCYGGVNYNYIWEPNGEETKTVYAKGYSGQELKYVVGVTNTMLGIHCSGRDTVNVKINKQPFISFEPNLYILEGCEPFELKIDNNSVNSDIVRWDFGDGHISTERNPVHYYSAGQYDLNCYAKSYEGCIDSFKFENFVTVFPSPNASFTWEPEFPTVTNPNVQFINKTTGAESVYRWEIEYDKDYPGSVHTMTEKNPSFKWARSDNKVSGDYLVKLIVKSDYSGPSGLNTACYDTCESTIVVINDFLQFPNVITPNGDGINDVFEIKNLLEGGYPENSLIIYDKWGSIVFKVDNIKNKSDFWNPSGKNYPSGTYFYRFSGNGYNGKVEHNGVIEIIY